MYYYFSSDFPAVLKINGIFYGSIQETIKSLRFDDDSQTFIEICPLCKSEYPLNFFLPSDFLLNPPDSVTVTDLGGGYLIKALQSFSGGEFNVLSQLRFNNAVVTVFNENGLKISIETADGFFTEPIAIKSDRADIKQIKIDGDNFIAVILSNGNTTQKTVIIYSFSNGIKSLFMRQVDNFSFENGFSTTEKLCDILKHEITVSWQISNGVIKEKSRSVKSDKNLDGSIIPDKLLPYLLVEEIFAGGNFTTFLSDGIKENADKLPEYLGSFIGVMPPPTFRDISEVGLIYYNGKNKYKVKYYTFDISDGKICNVKRSTIS